MQTCPVSINRHSLLATMTSAIIIVFVDVSGIFGKLWLQNISARLNEKFMLRFHSSVPVFIAQCWAVKEQTKPITIIDLNHLINRKLLNSKLNLTRFVTEM